MYDFANPRANLGPDLFLAWAAWTCVWAALMIFLVAASGACRWGFCYTTGVCAGVCSCLTPELTQHSSGPDENALLADPALTLEPQVLSHRKGQRVINISGWWGMKGSSLETVQSGLSSLACCAGTLTDSQPSAGSFLGC